MGGWADRWISLLGAGAGVSTGPPLAQQKVTPFSIAVWTLQIPEYEGLALIKATAQC